jgi:hypothetical protein
MNQFLRPVWVYLVTALPAAILLFLFGGAYQVVGSLLSKENKLLWVVFGTCLILMNLAFCGYALYQQIRREKIKPALGFCIVGGYIPFLYLFLYNASRVIPFNVPQWMLYEGDLTLYVFTFLMPGIGYGLFLLMLWLTPADKKHSKALNVIPLVGVPAFWYLFYQVGLSVVIEADWAMHAFLILLIISTTVFLLFLIRLAYLTFVRGWKSEALSVVAKSIVLLVLPITGLIFNKNFESFSGGGGFFGDFSHPVFYVLAVLNGLLYIVPSPEHKLLRTVLFIGRSITYSFVVYFFFVLLPFFPLSVIAIIALGFGFLMLTPIIVMLVTTNILLKDIRYLTGQYSRYVPILLFVIGFMVIPVWMVIRFAQDKASLHRALEYVYSPDVSDITSKGPDPRGLMKTIEAIRANKDMRGRRPVQRKPYISPFFEWFVLDNLTLSDQKLKNLEMVFTDASDTTTAAIGRESLASPASDPPRIGKVTTDEESSRGFQSTWVHLDITNGSSNSTEYTTSFTLPEGCWISDYYLEIGGKREYGILAEKKAATWVYQQITTRERRDPGILFYTEGKNRIAFRVFPFSAQETRRTGFRVDHIEPFRFSIDGMQISSAMPANPVQTVVRAADGLGYVILSKVKNSLPIVNRTPYFHFIIDCSKSAEGNVAEFKTRIDSFLARQNFIASAPVVTLMNYRGKTVAGLSWKEEYERFPKSGGFFLERALKSALFEAYEKQEGTFPIPVVLSDELEQAVVAGDFSGFMGLVPEVDRFFVLGSDGGLTAHPFAKSFLTEATVVGDLHPSIPTRVWMQNANCFYLPDDSTLSIVPLIQPKPALPSINGDRWQAGLQLRLFETVCELCPRDADRNWLAAVKGSFASHVLTRTTSFIALENEAQRQALLKKQKTVLNARKALDIGEEQRMSEPSFWIILGVFAIARVVFGRRRFVPINAVQGESD